MEVAADTAPSRAGNVADRVLTRSGKARLLTLAHLDGRTNAARRAAALAETFAAELGGNLTPTQRIRVETAAALSAIAEDAQMRRLAGDITVSLDDMVRAASAARRAVRDLGLDRKREPAPVESFAEIAARAQAAANERRALELAEDDEDDDQVEVPAEVLAEEPDQS